MDWLPVKGEVIEFDYKEDIFNGMVNYKINYASKIIPKCPKQLLSMLCDMTIGAGEATKERIYSHYGDDWETQFIKDRAQKVIAEKLAIKLCDSYLALMLDKDHALSISWMLSKGISSTDAGKAYDKWTQRAAGIIEANCYDLTQLDRVGFIKVDTTIRHNFNIADSDQRRISAGIFYAFNEATNDGSTIIDYWQLINATVELLGASQQSLSISVDELLEADKMIYDFETGLITTAILHRNEQTIKKFVGLT
jgi:hypothetical protein